MILRPLSIIGESLPFGWAEMQLTVKTNIAIRVINLFIFSPANVIQLILFVTLT
jgi:hypothetical protein